MGKQVNPKGIIMSKPNTTHEEKQKYHDANFVKDSTNVSNAVNKGIKNAQNKVDSLYKIAKIDTVSTKKRDQNIVDLQNARNELLNERRKIKE